MARQLRPQTRARGNRARSNLFEIILNRAGSPCVEVGASGLTIDKRVRYQAVRKSLLKSGSVFEPPPSFVNSLLLFAAATALSVLTRDSAQEPETDQPLGTSQSRREPLSVQLKRAQE